MRQLTRDEFQNLKKGDSVYVSCEGDLFKSCVISPPFFNADADEPGWEVETTNGYCDQYSLRFPDTLEKFLFRGQMVSYMYNWSDEDTYGFDFGDGEFKDSEGLDYFIHLEYHVADDEWIVEVFWEASAEALGFEGSDEYLTEEEKEEVIAYAKQFIEEE